MKKKLLAIFVLIFLNSCGFQPIYNSENLKQFSLKITDIEGDRELNNLITKNLKIYDNEMYKKKINLSIKTDYKKNILTKNKQGKPTDYELVIKTDFKINFNNKNNNLEIIKKFNIKSMDNTFQEREYERTIKQNLINTTTNELINKISLLE